ncbi:MAG: TetR/AcrR family transcriptional regulator [Bryobacteraceae bacterium]|jgi:AcrR family transcriptional regulator
MARPPDPGIRARLRDETVGYVLSHGVGDLALRPLAKALKTNARMLIYHFGSREGLMSQILIGLREREDARIRTWFRTGERPRTLPQFLRWYWKRLSSPRARPGLRLIFELYALALRNPQRYPGVLEDPLAYWQTLTEKAGVPSSPDAVEATLLLAATRGLLLDLCATGDRARVGRAMEALARSVESKTKGE